MIVYFTDDTSANVGHVAGADGDTGLSAYEVWLSLGNEGTESDFIASINTGIHSGETAPTDPTVKLWHKTSDTGAGTFLHIRWSAAEPDSDSDLKTTPDAWVGLCSGATEIAPTAYTAYAWYSWKGLTGAAGAAGRGISSIARTSGTGAAGTTDTYTITFTDSTTTTFNVVNGADGEDGSGSGDMLKSAYDTNNDGVVNDSDKLGGVAASGYAKEISGQAEVSSFALDDYLAMYDTSTSTAKKGSVETLFYKLLSTGNTYLAAGTRANIATLDSLQTVIGKLMKWYADFATVVFTGSYTNLLDKPTSMAPTAHKSTHATGGGDALTAADIGAQATITGGASTITSSNLTASRALASNSSGKVAVSSVTATELGYVSGVTSAIQTQINGKLTDVVNDATPQLGGELDCQAHSIGFTEYDNGNSGTSKAIDWRLSNHQKVTMTGNCTFTFTAPSKAGMYSLRIIQDATGGRTITLPTMKKPGGTAFTHSTAANSIDILSIYYDGSAYYGQLSPNFL